MKQVTRQATNIAATDVCNRDQYSCHAIQFAGDCTQNYVMDCISARDLRVTWKVWQTLAQEACMMVAGKACKREAS